MLNDTLMEYSTDFSLIWHLQKKIYVILFKTDLLHKQLRKLSKHYAVCLGNLMERIELLARVCGPWISMPKALWFLFVSGELKSVVCAKNPHNLEAMKQNIREEIYNIQQTKLQQISRYLLERIQACLTSDGRHFEHFFYNGGFNINYCIWLIINKRNENIC
jgi:hypothetical protein